MYLIVTFAVTRYVLLMFIMLLFTNVLKLISWDNKNELHYYWQMMLILKVLAMCLYYILTTCSYCDALSKCYPY